MRKFFKIYIYSDFVLKIKGIYLYYFLSYISGDIVIDFLVYVGCVGMLVKESLRKESLFSYLIGSFLSLYNFLEGIF